MLWVCVAFCGGVAWLAGRWRACLLLALPRDGRPDAVSGIGPGLLGAGCMPWPSEMLCSMAIAASPAASACLVASVLAAPHELLLPPEELPDAGRPQGAGSCDLMAAHVWSSALHSCADVLGPLLSAPWRCAENEPSNPSRLSSPCTLSITRRMRRSNGSMFVGLLDCVDALNSQRDSDRRRGRAPTAAEQVQRLCEETVLGTRA